MYGEPALAAFVRVVEFTGDSIYLTNFFTLKKIIRIIYSYRMSIIALNRAKVFAASLMAIKKTP